MYPDTGDNKILAEAEINDVLKQAIKEALIKHPNHCTVCIIIHNDTQRTLGQIIAQNMAKDFGNQCLRQADRVLFIKNINDPLGKIKLFDNYLTIEVFREYFSPEAIEKRNRKRNKQRINPRIHKLP